MSVLVTKIYGTPMYYICMTQYTWLNQ